MWTGNCSAFPFPARRSIQSATIIGGSGKRFRIPLPAGCPTTTFPVGGWSCDAEKPSSTCISRSARRKLMHGFAMPFRCPMRCRCRSRPTGAGITGVFRRNRRGYFKSPVAPQGSTKALIAECKPTETPNAPAGCRLSVEIVASAIQASPASVVEDNWNVKVTGSEVTPQ